MSRWFRVYDELVDDPKVQRLPDDLFKFLINIWCLASKHEGKLPPVSHIAYTLRAPDSLVVASLEALVSLGLADRMSNQHGSWIAPHAWNKRQYKSDSSTERVKRFRNVSPAVTETPPETETETEQIQSKERKKERARDALSPGWPSDYRQQFWNAYPNKVGKAPALARLDRLARSDRVTWEAFTTGLDRYIHKADDRPWCNPQTWINQDRWLDQPATVKPNGATNSNGHGRRTIHDAANDLVEHLRKVQGSDSAARGGAGADVVRLLPKG